MPAFIKEITLRDWRTFSGRTCIAFHECSGMSAVLGHNGAGKSSFLDAVAFVTCARGSKTLSTSDASTQSHVEVRLADGSTFERCGDGRAWVNNELVSEQVYADAVRSRISTYYLAQLSRPRDFFEPAALARFIECEELVNVEAPPLVSLEHFAALEDRVQYAYEMWRAARERFLSRSTEAKAAVEDLAALRRSQRMHRERQHWERQILLLRHQQVVEAFLSVEHKVKALDRAVQLRQRLAQETTARIDQRKARLKRIEHELALLSHDRPLRAATDAYDAESHAVICGFDALYDLLEREIATNRDNRKGKHLADQALALETLLHGVRATVQTCLADPHAEPRRTLAVLSDAAREYDKIIAHAVDGASQAERCAAKDARQDYEHLLESHRSNKQLLLKELCGIDTKLCREDVALSSARPQVDTRAMCTEAVQQLKEIPGFIGVLHELVRPDAGYEKALWCVMVEDAGLILVRDKESAAECRDFLERAAALPIPGIVDMTAIACASQDKPKLDEVRRICPEAFELSTRVNVTGTDVCSDKIKWLATKDAVVIRSVSEVSQMRQDALPACTYCDTEGTSMTPERRIRNFFADPADTATAAARAASAHVGAPNQAPADPAMPIDEQAEALFNEKYGVKPHGVPRNEADLGKRAGYWLCKRIKQLNVRIRRLEQSIRKEDYNAQHADVVQIKVQRKSNLTLCLQDDTEPDKKLQAALLESAGLLDPPVLRLYADEAHRLCMRSVELLDNARELALECLRAPEARRRDAVEKVEGVIEKLARLHTEACSVQANLTEDERQQRQVRDEELVPMQMVRALLQEDLQYLGLAREATQEAVMRAYEGIDRETQSQEMNTVQRDVETREPAELIRMCEAERAKAVPLTVTNDAGVLQEMSREAERCAAARAEADQLQKTAVAELNDATALLEAAKKSRTERVTANVAELTRRASSTYQAVVVGRQAAPRIRRLFLVPLDDTNPWKGVMCACHPVGKQRTPVVQLSSGEMAVAELCVKMAALAGDGTRLVLYDEVDAGLDMLACNAFANFIRRRTGSPGGGQAIVATHKRATFNTAHNLLGLYRERMSPGAELSSKGLEPTAAVAHALGPTRIVMHRRRIDTTPARERAAARPQNPAGGEYNDLDVVTARRAV